MAAIAPPPAAAAAQGAIAPAPTAAPVAERRRGPAGSVLLGIGPVIGWFYGGQLSLGGSIRLSERLSLAIQAHGGGGLGIDGDNGFVTGIGELSIRRENWSSVGLVGIFGAGVAYLGEFEDGLDYEYVAPHSALGLGFMAPSGGRFAVGVEAKARLGYSINTYNYPCEAGASWCEDYSGFYGMCELMGVLHL